MAIAMIKQTQPKKSPQRKGLRGVRPSVTSVVVVVIVSSPYARSDSLPRRNFICKNATTPRMMNRIIAIADA